jgi:3',5'-cyclic AMP phosphodiesterase CpdA
MRQTSDVEQRVLVLPTNPRTIWRVKLLSLICALAFLAGSSCAPDNAPLLPPESGDTGPTGPQRTLIARFVHMTDTHAIDTASPARWAGAHQFTQSAWRPWEAYSTQILDGIVRAANRMHAAGTNIDFVLHTGDACDNAQSNEFGWLIDIMDGRLLNPLSGPDDRAIEDRPPPLLDPYAPFQPQGLYRTGVQGAAASIPWFDLIGNHDTYGIGTFPIVDTHDGSRVCPLPLSGRPGLLLPTVWDPVGSLAWGNVTPADPGPPRLLEPPRFVAPNPEREYIRKPEIIQALLSTQTGPAGHGFTSADGPTWYSVTPVPGVRLIGLDTADQVNPAPGSLPYQDGSISQPQADWLRSELDASKARGEVVIVTSHHPSGTLEPLYGTALDPQQFRDLLNGYPNVVLHICGHLHRNRVALRGGYVEIETCSTLDPPQEARVVELWRAADGSVTVAYRTFSHLDESTPPLGDDPLRPMRETAHQISEEQKGQTLFKDLADTDGPPAGQPSDREGEIRLGR